MESPKEPTHPAPRAPASQQTILGSSGAFGAPPRKRRAAGNRADDETTFDAAPLTNVGTNARSGGWVHSNANTYRPTSASALRNGATIHSAKRSSSIFATAGARRSAASDF